jgi:hypothetical protein
MIIVGYQDKDMMLEMSHPQVYTYALPYNCGIGYARNDLMQKALAFNCDYTLLTADSILFNESMKYINTLLPCFQKAERKEWDGYDLIGLNLLNRIEWEAKLNLIPNESFELDFIEKNVIDNNWCIGDTIFNVWDCDIVRNFWLARTEAVLEVPYDCRLVMCEHEDWFYRFKQAGYKVGCTKLCSGTYNKIENTPEYSTIREENFRLGKQRLLEKYQLKKWVTYKNIERIKNG